MENNREILFKLNEILVKLNRIDNQTNNNIQECNKCCCEKNEDSNIKEYKSNTITSFTEYDKIFLNNVY